MKTSVNKMLINGFVSILPIFVMTSCKKQILAPSTDYTLEGSVDNEIPGKVQQLALFKFDVVLTFYSAGQGVDVEMYKDVVDNMSNYSVLYNKEIIVKEYSFGVEGEKDVCVNMVNLDMAQKDQLKTVLMAMASASETVIYKENSERPDRK